MGRFFVDKMVNYMVMQHRIVSLWRPRTSLAVTEIKPNLLFLFRLFRYVNLQLVLDNGPWSFDAH